MARSSLVCLCLRCLPAISVAFGHNIQFASVLNTTFETASVSYYLEKSTSVLSSALCRHFSLWFCIVPPPNITAQHAYADFESGISLTAHREEIDHHVLNPMAPAPWNFPFWVHNHNTSVVEIRPNTSSYGWTPEVSASTTGPSTKYMAPSFHTIRSYVYQLLFAYPSPVIPIYYTFPRPVHDYDKYFDIHNLHSLDHHVYKEKY